MLVSIGHFLLFVVEFPYKHKFPRGHPRVSPSAPMSADQHILTSRATSADGSWFPSLRKFRTCLKYAPSRSIKYCPSLSVSSSCRPLNMAANMEFLSLVSVERVVTKLCPPTLREITRGKDWTEKQTYKKERRFAPVSSNLQYPSPAPEHSAVI